MMKQRYLSGSKCGVYDPGHLDVGHSEQEVPTQGSLSFQYRPVALLSFAMAAHGLVEMKVCAHMNFRTLNCNGFHRHLSFAPVHNRMHK
jgi:hypothetical protein